MYTFAEAATISSLSMLPKLRATFKGKCHGKKKKEKEHHGGDDGGGGEKKF